VLPEEVIQFLLPAAYTVGIPAGQPQGFSLGRAAILGYKDDFEHNPRASWSRTEGWDECEEPATELHKCIKGEVV